MALGGGRRPHASWDTRKRKRRRTEYSRGGDEKKKSCYINPEDGACTA